MSKDTPDYAEIEARIVASGIAPDTARAMTFADRYGGKAAVAGIQFKDYVGLLKSVPALPDMSKQIQAMKDIAASYYGLPKTTLGPVRDPMAVTHDAEFYPKVDIKQLKGRRK